MKKISDKKDIINKISKCAKDYKKNLENKKLLFLIENKNRTLSIFEVIMFPSNFHHLTGTNIIENGKKINSLNFYQRFIDGNVKPENLRLKDSTSYYKIKILPQLMNLDKMAKMIGEFDNSRIFLQTDKIIGNVNACMGFIKIKNNYIPNTALNEDIRSITSERKKIIAILKKDIKEDLYREITYLKNNYDITQLLKYDNIEKIVDFHNLTSNDRQTIIKILDFNDKIEKLQLIFNKEINEDQSLENEESEDDEI